MTGFRVESAMRMEFRRKAECTEVYNDDRFVARIEGDFVSFSADADLSVDEVDHIVRHAREIAERERRHREHLAAYDTMRQAVRVLCAYEQVPVPFAATVVIDGMHCTVPMEPT